MAYQSVLAGATSQSITVDIYNSTTGLPLTGLAFNTAGLIAYYSFSGANATATSITLATLAAVNSAYSSGGFKELDATNMQGDYRFDIPNAMIAAAKGQNVTVTFSGATNMAPRKINIELTAVNNQSTAFGLVLAKTTNITGFNDLAAAAIATGVWQDATAGDFTTASSIGKSLYTSGVVPGGTNGLFIAGTNAATTVTTSLTTTFTGNLTGSVGSVTGLTASNLDATVSSRMATYTQPTGFLAATFPTGTVANTTNITAGTITTATNLTNAPTAGDFTAVMKTSLSAATPVATLSSAYDFAKGTAAMTESYAAQGATLTAVQALYGINQFLSQHSTSATTWTVKKRDGSTTAKTYTLDSATSPTSLSETT